MFLKNRNFYFIFTLLLTDCITFLLSFTSAFYCRFYLFGAMFSSSVIYPFAASLQLACLLLPIWIIFINLFIGYKFFYISKFNLFIKIFRTSSVFIILLFALIFITKNDYSRMLIVFMWCNLIIFTFIFRYILKRAVSYFIYKLNIRNNLLVIGKNVRKYKKIFNNYYLNKVFYYPYTLNKKNAENLQLLAVKKQIREIIIINYSVKEEYLLPLCDWAQKKDIDIKIIPNEVQTSGYNIVLDDTLGIPVILLISNPVQDFDYFIKRLFDTIFAAVFLAVLSPLFVILAVLIKAESKGPVFYKHKRIGYNEKEFYCYKFRSMVNDSDKKLKELINNSIQQNNAFLKLKDDARITKIGKFIRKYSIDEIPQMINVLKGEMSLVGPRPIVQRELDQIKKIYPTLNYNKMFKVLPGITGLWQVSGRSLLADEKRLELEIYYVNNWSLNLDAKILLKTVSVVLFSKGAY